MDPEKAKKEIMEKLSTVIDPEIGIDIVNLGLVYGVDVDLRQKRATVKMTMTTPACPLMGVILMDVEQALEKVESVETVTVELVWDPPWTQERMSEKAKRMLGVNP
ncbi:MAG: metal-sulfur cluster assembly factor [Candidatus Micrarchaeota archaeon]|nr:metal-sulfur cluster assembly factor [Candidatus Micrarchaeota archaeon]